MLYRSHPPLVQRAATQPRTSSRKKQAVYVIVGGLFVILLMAIFTTSVYAQQIHRVRVGETLGTIAVQYGTNISTLANANGISNPNHIYVGQQLSIPTGTQSISPPRGSRSNLPIVTYPKSNRAAPTMACRRSARAGETIHYVRAGDTLSGIASRYGVGLSSLRSTNSLWSDRISIGQCIIIPSGIRATPAPDRWRQPQVVPAVVTPAPLKLTYSTP